MRRSAPCGYLCSSRALAATLRDLRRLAGVFPHPQHAVDLSAFLYQQSFRMHVAMNDTRRLKLDSLLGVDRSAHVAADDGLAAHHVAFHFPAPCDQHLRSEEHTSELQSRLHLVCRLLLEKKNTGTASEILTETLGVRAPRNFFPTVQTLLA